MPHHLKIPNGGVVLVCDGRKALILRNQGDELYPTLQVHDTAEAAGDPSATDHGNGTSARSASGGHHSAIEPTDRHELAERRFADEAVALLVKHSPGPSRRLAAELPTAHPFRFFSA